MPNPKPISLTQVSAGAYKGETPQAFVVVGPIPGGGSGGGPVEIADVTGLEDALDDRATVEALAELATEATAALDELSDVVAARAADLNNVFGKLGGLTFVKTTAANLPPENERPADTIYFVVG